MPKKETAPGKMSIDEVKKLINKDAGSTIAFSANDKDSPNNVPYWIPTGSRLLDSIICKGKLAGIPGGKITEIAGLEGVGKSFLAQIIAANAQKMGLKVLYFDSESALDPAFSAELGCNIDEMIYVQPPSLEKAFEMMEKVLAQSVDRWLFIIDSYANTPTESTIEGSFDPTSSMALGARISTRAMQKLTLPLANHHSTLLVLNQLKTNIAKTPAEAILFPYFAPGGKALHFAYSLRIWLTKPRNKDAFIHDEKGYKIGSEVKVKLEKSRFGSEARVCSFKLLWGSSTNSGIQDKESWWPVIKNSARVIKHGHRFELEGTGITFWEKDWMDALKEEVVLNKAIAILDEVLIENFAKKLGEAKEHYLLEGEQEPKTPETTETEA